MLRSSWPVGDGEYKVTHVSPSGVTLSATSTRAWIPQLHFQTSGTASSDTLACNTRLLLGNRGGPPSIPTTALLGLTLNTRSLPSVQLRQALLGSIQASGTSVYAPIPTWPRGDTSLRTVSGPAAPRTLFERAGWNVVGGHWMRRGQRLAVTLVAPSGPASTRVTSLIARIWRRDHIEVVTLTKPFPTLVRAVLYPHAFDAAILEWDFQSPDYDPQTYWASGSPLNFSGLRDNVIDRLASSLPLLSSLKARDASRQEINRLVLQDAGGIGLAPLAYSCHVPGTLHGFETPRMVTDSSGLFVKPSRWYVKTKIVFRNPLTSLRRMLRQHGLNW